MSMRELVSGAADRVMAAMGVLDRPFPIERMLAQARRRTGLDDFGTEDFVVPLRRLLDSCASEASLSLVGRFATQWDVARFLGNLLRMRQTEIATPAILQQRILAPTFITGLPRSGTTWLHTLLTQDPDNMAPAVWQTIYPYAGKPAKPGERDRRIERVAKQLRLFERLAPEFKALHPLQATSPQECSEITAHVFASLRFDTTYRIPSYRAWLDASGHLSAYRFHYRFLQHLQYQHPAPGRWVLKCPDHLFALEAIRAVYPDARMVFVHRDPLRVLESITRLTEVLRRPFSRCLDTVEIGQQVNLRWQAGTQRMIEAADAADFPVPICHIRYRDLVANPLGTIEAMYGHFGLSLSPAVADRIRRQVREQPNGGYGANHYRIERYGLDFGRERGRFAEYMARFDIAPEPRDRCSRERPASLKPRGTSLLMCGDR